ncbi:SLBB domain-containing protein [bacterium]|nr:SLBB domain-containing protein [bacterium]
MINILKIFKKDRQGAFFSSENPLRVFSFPFVNRRFMGFSVIILSVFIFMHIAVVRVFASRNPIQDYIIGPQDELKIEVWDHPDLTRQVSVSLTGSFTFPLIGEVKASGITTEQVQKVITQRLADGYLINPQVTVTITAYRSKQVNVLGEINKPGTYPYTRQTSLIEIISMAGGLTEEAGPEAYILHSDGADAAEQLDPLGVARRNRQDINQNSAMEKIDLNSLLQSGQNIYFQLKENDTIYIPRADFFYVLGEVKNPGQYKIERDITVLKAITRAGGHTKKANLKKITIIRVANGREWELHARLSDPLLPDDIIKIPESFF